MPDPTTRPRRPEELADHVAGRLRVLDRGITELDGGEKRALDDIVTAARALACPGKGNAMLFHFQRTVDKVPDVHPVTSPVPLDPDITFATGALPAQDGTPGDVVPRSLKALMDMRCLVVVVPGESEQRAYDWGGLTSQVAAKLGAIHSDPDVPLAFDELQRFEVGGQDALAHGLRNVGVVISRFAHGLLDLAGVDHGLGAPTHTIPAAGTTWTGAVEVRDRRAFTVEFSGTVLAPPAGQHRHVVPLFNIPTQMSAGEKKAPRKIGRNEPCPCGSGSKYKRCCGR